MTTATLHMLCGKIAAGKSTLATKLATAPNTVLVSEDDWLDPLFGDQMTSPADYVACAAKLRAAMGPHVATLLNSNMSVVLDFPANTVENRNWMRGILEKTEANHELHVLTPPDEVCIARMHARNAQGDHPFAATEAQFHRFSKHFVPPEPKEGFNVIQYNNEM
ncbi:cell division protein ZipA [Actibacterium mucosum KCTC 23349]|uniref:Cell division protein ZipA n=1 Tax=Actibacterium mucosum KCTC 23349 TaxID=1454373 RepID=A0A037ZDJ1_9RHOB|nr:ATP-binding protein [Actibacterium mucosum]KAJ54544.1 cell division protein ZipA [Actibacterium mucosum KCTC 23349]